MLTDEQIWAAWDNAFDKPVNFDHKPTPDELILFRIKAVVAEAVKEERNLWLREKKENINANG